MNKVLPFCFLLLALGTTAAFSQGGSRTFTVIPLGIKGGIDESNLSSYMVAVQGTSDYICLDAGTKNYGIQKAIAAGLFKGSASGILKNNIKGYLISHPHLDHVSGLVINSPDDSPKNIYGLKHCIEVLKNKYFSWDNWANFGDEGEPPVLKKYHYNVLSAGIESPVENTTFSVRAFELSHGNPYRSTAFLIRHKESYLLYLGDTGADSIEKAGQLQMLWNEVSPLIKAKKLRAIFIEVSYPDSQPLNQLFGHLTPALFVQEMNALSRITGKDAVQGLTVVITHMKPSGANETTIRKELITGNRLRLKLVFPSQAASLSF